MNNVMFRDMQNPDQPNLPFAQRTNATRFRDMQNPDQPNLPFAQSSSSRSKMCYLVWSPTSPPNYKGTEMTLTDSTVISLRNKGFTVTPCSSGGGSTTTTSTYVRPDFAHDNDQYGYDYLYGKRDYQSDVDIWKKIHEMHPIGTGRSQIQKKSDVEKILVDYYGDDIDRLGTRITNLQTKVSEHSHGNGNGKDCGWDIVCHIEKLKAQIGGVALIGVAGIVGYILLKRKIKL